MTAPASASANTSSTSARTDASREKPRRTASASAPASAEKLAALAQLGVGGWRDALPSGSPVASGRGASAATTRGGSSNVSHTRSTPPVAQRPERAQRSDAAGDNHQHERTTRTPKAMPRATPLDASSYRPTTQQRPLTPRATAPHAAQAGVAPRAPVRSHPVLEKLAALYPRHFGAVFLPLKRGIFQDVLAAHPDVFDKAELKVALGIHTRSSRYLQAVASGNPRYDLQGQPVEPVAPEHMHHAVLEIFRRRQMRSEEDLSAQLRQRIGRVFEASGLTAEQYAQRVHSKAEATNTLVAQALQEVDASLVQAKAVHDAWVASGLAVADFAQAQAQSQGSDVRAVTQAVQRIERHTAARQAAEQAALAQAGKEVIPEPSEDGIAEESYVDDGAASPTTLNSGASDNASAQQGVGDKTDTAAPENT